MVFSSPTFLFLFLPVTLIVYHSLPVRSRGRNWWLLLASGVFYLWGAGSAILAILFVGVFSFGGAYLAWRIVRRQVTRADPGAEISVRWPWLLTVVIVLAPLIVFKYLPQVATLPIPGLSGLLEQFAATTWVLPLGISFFTFHAVSYVVDSARAGQPLTRSFASYLLYLFVFPHQIAGPIVRYSEIGPQIETFRHISSRQIGYGVTRFTWGLAKKVLIADNCGMVANAMFDNAQHPGLVSGPTAWIGAFAYAMQIYFDFSGYSDMAIGLAAMFGFRFPENFRAPYTSSSVTDFWRRWHITLTTWFRDYVYIPLGGNRRGVRVEYGALLLVFLLTSLWHGALLGFLIWGGLHSAALLFERVTGLRKVQRAVVLRRAITFFFVLFAWVPFRALTLDGTLVIWGAMVAGPWDFTSPAIVAALTPLSIVALIAGAASLVMPSKRSGFETLFGQTTITYDGFRWKLAFVLVPAMLALAVAMVLFSDFSPFLYFQF